MSNHKKYDVKRGLRDISGEGLLTGLTEISEIVSHTMVDMDYVPCSGVLRYRGINIKDLVKGFLDEDRFGFEETIYLLLFGELPTKKELSSFNRLLSESRQLPPFFVRDIVLKAPSKDMMNTLQRSVLSLYAYDNNPDDTSLSNVLRQCIELIARVPMLSVYGYKAHRHFNADHSLLIRNPKPSYSTAENILYTLRPNGKFTPFEAKILDLAISMFNFLSQVLVFLNNATTIETMNSSVSKTSTSNQYDDLVSVNLALDKNKSDLDLVNQNISDKIKDNEELSKFDKFSPELKTASSSAINALMNIALVSTKISNMCGDYEFKSIFDSKAGDDIVSQIDNIKIVNSNLEQQNIEYENQIHNIESGSINYDSLKSYVPSKCGENTCSLIRALIERSNNSSTNKISEIRQNIEINKSKIIENNRLIEEKQRICQNLQNALYDMTQVTDTLKTLDDKTYYLPDSLREEINSPIPYNVLMKCSLLLDESKKYDEYVSLLEKKESIEQTISNLNNISHVLSLSEENKRLLQESIDRRRELTEKLKDIKDELTTISNEKETLLSLKDKVDSLRLDFNNLNLEKDRLIALKKEMLEDNECLYNKNIISSCIRKLHELERNLTSDISTITAKIESYKTQMISVETLKSRKTALEVKKDLYELTYHIWSTDGYPSLLINDFLEEVTECTNKDLDSSWGGILNIKKPELESSALKIPVIRGNAELDDVSECSKAEKATLDLAISFGILEVSTIDSKFGIITRIDEKDSGMDVVRRQNFLDLLQERLKTINCINAFCITHSNCFENIEADVILLKNYESVTSENALDNKNIIYRFDKSV